MPSYDLRLQAAIDAASVAKDSGDDTDLRALLVQELAEREVETQDEAWLTMVVQGIQGDPDFMTPEEPSDFQRD